MCFGIEIPPKKIHFKEKQKMKKLGLIILMALVLTVGGVYATFNYAREEVASVTTQALAKGIAKADTTTPKGTIDLDVSQVLLRIDDSNKNHKTGLEIGNSVITVTFTPSEKAEPLVAADGVNLKLEISFANNTYTLNGVDYEVFKTTTPDYNATTGVVLGKGTKNVDSGKFEYTVDLSKYLTVSAIPLPTLADYEHFERFFTAAGNAVVTITVSEVK